jgi:predicted GNAT family acetyltransferase
MAFAVIENGRVLFKAEVGFSTNEIAQLQGVWVNHSVRGQGLAAPALAAAIVEIRTSIAQTVSLYVNDFNIPARKTYESVGFKQIATFATVLF